MRSVERPDAVTLKAAAAVVARHLDPTPVVPSPELGPGVTLKLESLQPTGSFNVRGGLAAVAAAAEHEGGARLVAASAGNHGLGVAYAADRLGADAIVVVAETASAAKVASLERFSVRLVRHGTTYDAAEARALELAGEVGGRFVSPYNDPDVVAGQATVATELAGQVAGLHTVVVPVGGGGLAAGICLATEGLGLRVVGVEPEQSAAMAAAIASGSAAPIRLGTTIADGLAGNIEEGSITVEICRERGVEMLQVTEEEIRGAMRFLAFEHGLVAEGAGAVAVAAVHAGRMVADDGTAVVVTGRNIAPPLLASVLSG
ncbi:MAG: threonine/serine dehydratase [Acidimicrobiales bacterium]